MTKGQRKMHFISWVILALCIPIGFISAILVIPEQSMQENVFLDKTPQLENILAERTQENVIALVRSDVQLSKYQLEILIATPFKTPDIGVYVSKDSKFNQLQDQYLGNLGSKGGERFELPKSSVEEGSLEIILFDPIKNELLNQISIKL